MNKDVLRTVYRKLLIRRELAEIVANRLPFFRTEPLNILKCCTSSIINPKMEDGQ